MVYTGENYINRYTKPLQEPTREEYIELTRSQNINGYRMKVYKAGDLLECDIYPVWKKQEISTRAKRSKVSRKAQEDLNRKNAQRHTVRITNANFKKNDLWVTLSYSDMYKPRSMEEARRDIRNYIARLKYRRKKKGLPELKYIYVTEWGESDGDFSESEIRCHHHLILSGGMQWEEVEEIWQKGKRNQVRPLRPDDYGLTGLAMYISKGRKHEKRMGHSKNLIIPRPQYRRTTISKRKIERIATHAHMAAEIFKELFAGYEFKDMEAKYSEYMPGAYIYARMFKRGNPE